MVGLIIGGQRNEHGFHKMVFDEYFLRRDLLDMGFREVWRWDWRTTERADVDDYSLAHIPHLHT